MSKTEKATETKISFLAGGKKDGWAANYADDEKVALIAVCVKSQQDAGFKNVIDLREASCPNCGSPGYNTGWGFWKHTCGAEVLTGEDGGCSDCTRGAAD